MLDLLVKAIDVHSHYNHGAKFDTKISPTYSADIDFLKNERLRLGVEKMICCSFASCISDEIIYQENEHCKNLCSNDDFLFQWVVVDPRKSQTVKQAQEFLKNPKVLGIKIHSVCHKYSFIDYADEIFALASEYKKSVIMHPDDQPEKIATIAGKYKDTSLILAHLGCVEHVNALACAENVYADTSGNASSQNNVIEYAVKRVGADKILFGTDTYSCAFQKGRILLADISDADKRKILYENAEKLLGLK